MLAFLPKKESKFSLNWNRFFGNKVLCINSWNKVSAIWASVLLSILGKIGSLNRPSVDQALIPLIRVLNPPLFQGNHVLFGLGWGRKSLCIQNLLKKGNTRFYFQTCKGGMRINSIKRLCFFGHKGTFNCLLASIQFSRCMPWFVVCVVLASQDNRHRLVDRW